MDAGRLGLSWKISAKRAGELLNVSRTACGLSSRVAGGGVIGDGTGRKQEGHWWSTRGRRQARAFLEDFC